MKIDAILLAAGSASRFGGGKLLARLPDGRPIGIASWRNLKSALSDGIVVVRAGDDAVNRMFEQEGAQVVQCPDAHLGMSRSLIAGLRASDTADAWVVALGDMPYVRPETIRMLSNALSAGALIALPNYQGRRGNPVGLSARLREELLNINGDEGARDIIKRHAHECVMVECDDPGILRDIDTPQDIA